MVAFVHDPAGNLVYDGQYVYIYDAWHRLTTVHEAGTLLPDDFDSLGRLDPDTSIQPVRSLGPVVATFRYDGLGRLIVAEFDNGTATDVEQYYYDGVRRIQTVLDVADPATDTTQAEYVYGPDYVDEFVLQTYPDASQIQQPMYMLADGNGNVVALTDSNGTLIEQYTWDPYGQQLIAETVATPAPDNRVGHQGLFYYHFGQSGLYYNRNRWYSPKLGRFITKDPNESGLLTLPGFDMMGAGPSVNPRGFDAEYHYINGLNLYGYVQNNPLVLTDPAGLLALSLVGGLFWGTDIDTANAAAVTAAGVAATGMIMQFGVIGMSDLDFDAFIDGIDLSMQGFHRLAEDLMAAAAAGIFASTSQGQAVKTARDQLYRLEEHATKVMTGGPNNHNNNGWFREIKAWLSRISGQTKHMKGKTQKAWRRFVDEYYKWLDNPWGGNPPSAPT